MIVTIWYTIKVYCLLKRQKQMKGLNMPEKPPSRIDREVLGDENYLFISYAHKDSDTVFSVLNNIYNLGVNYWYDKELDVGDVWHEVAGVFLRNEKCRGSVVFLSVDAVASDAVFQEVQIINTICKNDKSFRRILILLDSNNIADLIEQALIAKKNTTDDIVKKIGEITELSVDEDRIYHVHKDLLETCKVIEEQSKKIGTNTDNPVVLSIYDRDMLVKKHKFWLEESSYYIELGKYCLTEEDRYEPIIWKLIGQQDSKLIFISKYAIDFVEFSKISNVEKCVAAQLKSIPYINTVCAIDMKTFNKFGKNAGKWIATDYADLRRAQFLRAFWIKNDVGDSRNYAICNAAGKVLERRIVPNNINCGVRLVLTVDTSKIKE